MQAANLVMDRTAKIIVVIVIIVASGFFVYSKFAGWHASKLEATIKQEQEIWQDKADKMNEEINSLKNELAVFKKQNAPKDKLAEVFGENQKGNDETVGEVGGAGSEDKIQPGFTEVEDQISGFFSYLDERPYVQSFKFKEGTYLQYQIAIRKLSSKLPVISGEMSSLYNIVRNVAHFYRVIGKKRVLLIKQTLQNESEVIEPVMKTFYQWFTMADGGQSTLQGRPTIKSMYEYAGYILNTLGGRSYLLRRSPKVRILTTYYCVLILDKANDEELNSRGIDIRPYLNSSLMEIQSQIGLVYQTEYLAKLNELRLKYYPN